MVAPVGILGGTFDPIHYGHLRFAQEVKKELGLTELRLLPAGRPPHRQTPVASAPHRLAMCELAVTDFSDLVVDPREAMRLTPSYTVLTLSEIRAEVGSTPLCFLLGADAFLGLPSWYRWNELFELAHLIIAERPHHTLPDNPPAALKPYLEQCACTDSAELSTRQAGLIYRAKTTPQDIAASTLRALLKSGKTPQDLLPPIVLAYIRTHALYK